MSLRLGTKTRFVGKILGYTLLAATLFLGGMFGGGYATTQHINKNYILLERNVWDCAASFITFTDETVEEMVQICVIYRVKGLDLSAPRPRHREHNFQQGSSLFPF